MLAKIGQELLIYDHLLAGGGILALLLQLFILIDQFLLANISFSILSSLLVVCFSLTICSILGLFEEFHISSECLLRFVTFTNRGRVLDEHDVVVVLG